MKVRRKIIEIDDELCNGCGECVPSCAEGALEIVAGKARMIAERYCDGLGACLGDCPQGALRIIERDADDFDEEAVEELLDRKKSAATATGSGCPSAKLRVFPGQDPCRQANQPLGVARASDSALGHWPVQIRLVPPSAPFLKNADLLIAADCAPVAYPGFHRDFLPGRAVMVGCPKFDDQTAYIDKFRQVFESADLNSITMLIMEVPCCGAMRGIIAEALKQAGKEIEVTEAVVGVGGALIVGDG
ncbi:MAG: 4Fe-4S ferredoxin [Desulfurivibrionaceae bacterium]|nr:4Fe-4S ferredoxin [Desulfurivibrionaceae bacterium]